MTKVDSYGALHTREEVEAVDEAFLTPRQASGILNCAPYSINVQAKVAPEKLGFPVSIIKGRVKIPKIPFINFIWGSTEKEQVHEKL